MRGRPTPSRPWGPVVTDCPVAQDRLRPPEPWGQEGARRRPSDPVCARPPSPPHSPPQRRSHRCGPGLTVVQWGLQTRGGGGGRQRRGTQDTLPRAGPGCSPRDPLPSWPPRGPQGQHASTRRRGGERSASPKPQGGSPGQRGPHGHPQCEHHLCASSQTDTRGQGSGVKGQDARGKPDQDQGLGSQGGEAGQNKGGAGKEGGEEGGEEEEGNRDHREILEPPSPPPGPRSSRCTSRGRWPSPSHSGPPHSCPAAAGRGFHAPPGPEGGEPRVTRQALSNAHCPPP